MAATTLHSKSWILLFTEISDEAPEQSVMEEAHDHMVRKCALPKLLDAVGLSDTDLRELLEYNKWTMPKRAHGQGSSCCELCGGGVEEEAYGGDAPADLKIDGNFDRGRC